jgi:aspartyl-tRNA(Asn)/glutamyl-tRNA(Gln) amidotransferase subunit B
MQYEAVIGLEVHVQLLTETKIFCRCSNRFGGEPNERVCPICLGYPGTLPVLNGRAVELATTLALALDCEVRERSIFERKNYFYADLPKGYQVSQFAAPLAERGRLPLIEHERLVNIRRLHLEEDAGKLLHETPGGGALHGHSLVDYNRCGVPLVEIVSEPELYSPEEAQDYMQSLHQVLLFTATSDGNLEEGSLRCDANISLRPRGSSTLGQKVEIKNLNSFRNVARSLAYEIDRQEAVLEHGGTIDQETRSFDAASGRTSPLRSKEEAHDYRYFPEPDLPPVIVTAERRQRLTDALPELPWQRRARFQEVYSLGVEDARALTADLALGAYFERAASVAPSSAPTLANWVRSELVRELRAREQQIASAPAPEILVELVRLIDDGDLSHTAAKEVLVAVWDGEERPGAAVDRLGLRKIQDPERLRAWAELVIEEHPGPAAQFRSGEHKVLGFLVGQLMRKSGGRADPGAARETLRSVIDAESSGSE